MEAYIIEIWKDIIGHEGTYQVSNLGRVKSLNRIIIYSNGCVHNQHGKILSGFINTNGYKSIDLYKNKKSKKYYIHRLVAEAFIPNPNNLPEVNHKDENKLNNIVDNLEWCTSSENKLAGTVIYRANKTRREKHVGEKQIVQFDLQHNFIKEYININEAILETGISRKSIYNSCNKKVKPRKFIFEYK